MSRDPASLEIASLFRVDLATPTVAESTSGDGSVSGAMLSLLKELVSGQQRQNELLEELLQQSNAAQKQRARELVQWKEANPGLAQACRQAVETLGRAQSQFLEDLTTEVMDCDEQLRDSQFLLSEFVDRFGPRLAHMNCILQVLAQLSGPLPAGDDAE